MVSPGTRLNSAVLCVTSVALLDSAIAAINRSLETDRCAMPRQMRPDTAIFIGCTVIERQRGEVIEEFSLFGEVFGRMGALHSAVEQLGFHH